MDERCCVSQVTREAAIRLADDLVVAACGHGPGQPFPPLPSPDDLAQAASGQGKIAVTRPKLKPRAATSPASSAVPPASQPAAASVHAPQGSSAPSGLAHAAPALVPHAATGPPPKTSPPAGLPLGKVPDSQQTKVPGQVLGAACPGPSSMPAAAAAAGPSALSQKPAGKGLSGRETAAEPAVFSASSASAGDGWVEVKHNGSKRKLLQLPAKASGPTAQPLGPFSGAMTSSNAFHVLRAEGAGAGASSSHAMGNDGVSATAQSADTGSPEAGIGTTTATTGAGAASVVGLGGTAGKGPKKDIPGAALVLSKAAKKNAAR